MILEPLASLEKHPDKKYAYWWKHKDATFLIKKYYKADYRPPFYMAVDPELLKEVNTQMERAMLLLYEMMLNRRT